MCHWSQNWGLKPFVGSKALSTGLFNQNSKLSTGSLWLTFVVTFSKTRGFTLLQSNFTGMNSQLYCWQTIYRSKYQISKTGDWLKFHPLLTFLLFWGFGFYHSVPLQVYFSIWMMMWRWNVSLIKIIYIFGPLVYFFVLCCHIYQNLSQLKELDSEQMRLMPWVQI